MPSGEGVRGEDGTGEGDEAGEEMEGERGGAKASEGERGRARAKEEKPRAMFIDPPWRSNPVKTPMLSSETMRSIRRGLVIVLGASTCAVLFWACTDGSAPPLGNGNMVNVDVDASAMSGEGEDADLGADSPFAPLDGPYGKNLGDAYGLAVCDQCACDGGTFCYGGAPSSPFSACDQTASTGAAPLEVGCHPIPTSCASATDPCVCLLQSLPRDTSCYPVCVAPPSGGFVVYCPH